MEKTNEQAMVNSTKVKLMCSYGGRIQPRLSNTTQLTYVGGDTKLLTVDRKVKFAEIVVKLSSLCNIVMEFCVKYQLPGAELDALVSILDDDDVEHMMFEYDNLLKDPTRSARIRLFLFGVRKGSEKSPGSGFPLNPDYLFGFDKEFDQTVTAKNDVVNQPALDYVAINKDNHFGTNVGGARDGHVTTQEYVYRVPPQLGPCGGRRMVKWAASIQDQKMGVNNQLC